MSQRTTFDEWLNQVANLVHDFLGQKEFNPETSRLAWESYYDAGYSELGGILHANFVKSFGPKRGTGPTQEGKS